MHQTTDQAEIKMDVERLAGELHTIIRRAVGDATSVPDNTWKNKYDYLKWRIRDLLADAEGLRDDMKQHGLTAGTIEAEGYLRCAITLSNLIEDDPATSGGDDND